MTCQPSVPVCQFTVCCAFTEPECVLPLFFVCIWGPLNPPRKGAFLNLGPFCSASRDSPVPGSTALLSFGGHSRPILCRGPVNLAPWVYCIPADLAPFHDFLAQLGVRDSFSARQYVGIMADMAAALKGERLSAEQQEQAIAVLQVIMLQGSERLYPSRGDANDNKCQKGNPIVFWESYASFFAL